MPKKKPTPDTTPETPVNASFQAFMNMLNDVGNEALVRTAEELADQSKSELHPAYFNVRFRTETPVTEWPATFVIITAYATTGETWSDERNVQADRELHQELLRRGCAPIRITGYDPESGHGEPGWAVALPLDEALELGRTFLQDAIFLVQGDTLLVAKCNSPWTQQAIGAFRERVVPGVQPLILHIPHAATDIPDRRGFLVNEEELLAEQLLLTDWFTDDLYSNPTDTAIIAPFSRIFCDVERFADDAQEVMAGVGMGVLYERTDAGLPLRTVPPDLRTAVLSHHYAPHHQRLSAAVDSQLMQHGQATIVDCHSFPANPLKRDLDQRTPRPDFNIGTDPFHTPQDMVERAVAYFAHAGYSLGVDWPYRGTLVPMTHYQRDSKVRSIMLEVSRDLYLLQCTNTRGPRFMDIKAVVQGFLDAMRRT